MRSMFDSAIGLIFGLIVLFIALIIVFAVGAALLSSDDSGGCHKIGTPYAMYTDSSTGKDVALYNVVCK